MSTDDITPARCLRCAHDERAHDDAGCSAGWTADATEPGCDCKATARDVLLEALAWADDD